VRLSVSIYKPCDIRGSVAAELTPELYRRWGRALGRQVEPMAKVVIGGDIRASTPEFLAALSDGLCEAGVDVVDLGLLPTPMIYYARQRLQAAACAIVTASHHAAELNGLKWMIGRQPPTPEEVAALRRQSESPSPPPCPRPRSTPRTLDVSFDYVAWLQETWVDALAAQCHVVLDPMHGCCAARARRYLHAIFPQCLFSAIHDTPDAAFAGGSPDCSRPQLLEELCEAVYRQRAHVGFAFDGDGDRLALVDNEGMPLSAEEATWVLLQSFGSQLQGEQFVYDLKFSDRIPEAAKELGAEPLVERSGQAFLRSRMLQTRALFGAGVAGRYFFRALEGGDDGLFTACWLIAYLARCRTTLAHLRRECPPVYMSPDLRIPLRPDQQRGILDRVRATWSQFPQQTLDGVRIDVPGGWALVRSSVTEPALTFRFESSDWHSLDDLVEHFCAALPEVGETLWSQYEAAMGTAGPRG
jgi:phosphomannomutase